MREKGLFIQELPHEGVVTFQSVVKEKDFRSKRNGGRYLALVLADRSGELDAKVWENPDAIATLFDRDDVVKVRGAIEIFNERPQLIVQRIRRCEAGEFDETDFTAASRYDPAEMLATLRSFVETIADCSLRDLLQSLLNDPDVVEPLQVASAAMRLHHAYRSGLLEHIVTICQAADLLVHTYSRLNRDWLIAGAILHDLGKLEELAISRSPSYTTRGQLVGHVAIGLEILERHLGQFPEFPADLKTALQHLIVSHHGEVAKGALRAPMFPEAMALHYLDELDARLNQAWHLIDQTAANEVWTTYVPSLERQLYCASALPSHKRGQKSRLST